MKREYLNPQTDTMIFGEHELMEELQKSAFEHDKSNPLAPPRAGGTD